MERIIILFPNFTHIVIIKWPEFEALLETDTITFFFLKCFSNYKFQILAFCTKRKNTMHEEKANLPFFTAPLILLIEVPNRSLSGTKVRKDILNRYVLPYLLPHIQGYTVLRFCFHWNRHIQYTLTWNLLFYHITYHEHITLPF